MAIAPNSDFEAMLRPLRARAFMLNGLSEPAPDARPIYDSSHGIWVWTDERYPNLSAEVTWGLFPLQAYRTSILIGAPRDHWRPYWDECVAMFPSWVGFRGERITPHPRFLAEEPDATHQLADALTALERKNA
jgi:hypothetical protein